jgi:RNA polymerase-binding transcription factor DksA
MKLLFSKLRVTCNESVEVLEFSPQVTFIHGPVSTGKSTVARLIDYCLGGDLETTPALRSEFLAAELSATIGSFSVVLEREVSQASSVRVTWKTDGDGSSVIAPLQASANPLIPEDIYNLSDLLFYFAGVKPIKVRKSKRDPDSPLIRLSFRDLMWYCYLQQDLLDSSFYRLEDTFKRNKSIDAMRFIVGFHSDRLNELDQQLAQGQDTLRTNRAAVKQIREFLRRFKLGTEVEITEQLQQLDVELEVANNRKQQIEQDYLSNTHAVEPLRRRLRQISKRLGQEETALSDLIERVDSQKALRAELVTAKVKAARADSAKDVLAGVSFERCPECGRQIPENRFSAPESCNLCGQSPSEASEKSRNAEVLRKDLNTRIDELSELIEKHEREASSQRSRVAYLQQLKNDLDRELTSELAQYDSAYVSQVRTLDRQIAELEERQRQLRRLSAVPQALEQMQAESGKLQGEIEQLKAELEDEQRRLTQAAVVIKQLEKTFLAILQEIGFPGVGPQDRVEINTRNWRPGVFHGHDDEIGWNFFEAGSGGKKVLFNVCYALAIHKVAAENNMPLPTFLIVDGPTKNISADVNPALVGAYFRLIYSLAEGSLKETQFILIDSELVEPADTLIDFRSRLMSTSDQGNPPLISYYDGP